MAEIEDEGVSQDERELKEKTEKQREEDEQAGKRRSTMRVHQCLYKCGSLAIHMAATAWRCRYLHTSAKGIPRKRSEDCDFKVETKRRAQRSGAHNGG